MCPLLQSFKPTIAARPVLRFCILPEFQYLLPQDFKSTNRQLDVTVTLLHDAFYQTICWWHSCDFRMCLERFLLCQVTGKHSARQTCSLATVPEVAFCLPSAVFGCLVYTGTQLSPHKSVACRLVKHTTMVKVAADSSTLKMCVTLCGVRGMFGSSTPLWCNNRSLHVGWHWTPLLTHLQPSNCTLRSSR